MRPVFLVVRLLEMGRFGAAEWIGTEERRW
jgi:hypothetical protein